MIDDYNHMMGGVDLTDQRISYYHPDLHCFRKWMPMCLQILSLIRNNSYCIHKDDENLQKRNELLNHKVFTLGFIKSLMKMVMDSFLGEDNNMIQTPPANINIENESSQSHSCASSISSVTYADIAQLSKSSSNKPSNIPTRKSTRTHSSSSKGATDSQIASKRKLLLAKSALPPKPKRAKIVNKKIVLSDYDHIRLLPPLENHKRVKMVVDDGNKSAEEASNTTHKKGKVRQACVYCSMVYDEIKEKEGFSGISGEKVKWDRFVKRTLYQCSVCNVPLCEKHFGTFHQNNKNE